MLCQLNGWKPESCTLLSLAGPVQFCLLYRMCVCGNRLLKYLCMLLQPFYFFEAQQVKVRSALQKREASEVRIVERV